jgi:1-acyl-sn-glycerol-3-phosphate acyltransferase
MRRIFLAIIYLLLMRGFLRIIVGVKYFNRAALKKNRKFILVSNHNSHIDTMALMSALSFSSIGRTQPVAAGDYFGSSRVRAFFTRLLVNAILIPRVQKPGSEGNPIRLMMEALDKGNSVILFPEGSRGEPEKMQAFKRGIGLLLKKRKDVPYIPVFMKGLGKVLPKGRFLLVPFESDIYFGEPRYALSDDIDGIVAEIEASVLGLSEVYHQKLKNNELG